MRANYRKSIIIFVFFFSLTRQCRFSLHCPLKFSLWDLIETLIQPTFLIETLEMVRFCFIKGKNTRYQDQYLKNKNIDTKYRNHEIQAILRSRYFDQYRSCQELIAYVTVQNISLTIVINFFFPEENVFEVWILIVLWDLQNSICKKMLFMKVL